MQWRIHWLVPALLLAGCGSSSDSDEQPNPSECDPGQLLEGGQCVLDPYRHEPDMAIDGDNVSYGNPDDALQLLELGPPPKSGFRLVMEPRIAEPGADAEECHSWSIPESLTHRWVYTAELSASPGLHHANLYGLPIDQAQGEQPYPGCRVRADVTIFGQIGTILGGGDTTNLIVPNVLFANSTQVIGGERYALGEGYAYEIPEGFEVMTDVHLQNTTPDELRVEAAWDFYTMSPDLVTNPSAIFVYIWLDFLLPTRSQKDLVAECEWGGGEVAAIMPHTHQWATGFKTEFGQVQTTTFPLADDTPYSQPVLGGWMETAVTPYERLGTGLADSDIETYEPAIDTTGSNGVRFTCSFDNTTDHDMCFGIGENEMCFLFGYTSPPEAQRVGIVLDEGTSCLTVDPADARKGFRFDRDKWLATQSPEGAANVMAPSLCPYQQ